MMTLARPNVGPVAVIHLTVRPVKDMEALADGDPLLRNEPPLAADLATPVQEL